MEFLKTILGEELYKQFETAVNAYNGNEANKDKQIKLADLGSGEYVSKGKYSTLEAENQTNASKLTEANNLIAQLQKATKDDQGLQEKVTAYEKQIEQLNEKLRQTQIDAETTTRLLAEGVKSEDIDYLLFKIKSNGALEQDSEGKVKGLDEKIAAAKTQYPTHFPNGDNGNGGFRPYDGGGLPKGGQTGSVTREQFLSMGYNERLKLKQENEHLYKQYAKN